MYNSSLCACGDSYNCDDELEALSTAARSALEPDAQLAAIREMVDYDLNNPHRIPLWVLNDAYGVNQRVQGWALAQGRPLQIHVEEEPVHGRLELCVGEL